MSKEDPIRNPVPLAAIAVACALSSPSARAANRFWVGGTAQNYWDVDNNWSPKSIPAAGDSVFIESYVGNKTALIDATFTTPYSGNGLTKLELNSGAPFVTSFNLSGSTLVVKNGPAGTTVAGEGVATINHSGGTHDTALLTLAPAAGATATYNLSGNALLIAPLQQIGSGGVGIFNHSGGVNTVTTLRLGDTATGDGTYNLTNTATLTATDVFVGNAGTGAFNTNDTAILTVKHLLRIVPTGTLHLDPAATLDLTTGGLVVDYDPAQPSPLADIRAKILAAYDKPAAGHWKHAGITSSTAAADPTAAVGYASAAAVLAFDAQGHATFLGQQVDASTVLARYTKSGDADLDGKVGFPDLVKVAQNYDTTGSGTWATGDFDFDGNVGFTDLVKVAQNYDSSVSAAVPGASDAFAADWVRALAAAAAVPEPGAISLMFLTLLPLARRRQARPLISSAASPPIGP